MKTDKFSENQIDELLSKVPEGPWFADADAAEDCGPHRHSGLALVDTGRESDWPIARLCYWPVANLIAAAPALIAQLRARAAELETAGRAELRELRAERDEARAALERGAKAAGEFAEKSFIEQSRLQKELEEVKRERDALKGG